MVKIGKYKEEYLLQRAQEIVDAKTAGSKVMDADAEAAIVRFDAHEITLGNILGIGGFCTVSEVKKVTLCNEKFNPTNMNSINKNRRIVLQDRNFIATHYIRNNDARYAIKTLSPSLMKDPERFVAGVIDLVIETKLLSVIRHPNIVKMRAISKASPFSIGYFIILDRLYDTMTNRLQAWKSKRKQITGYAKVRDLKGEKKKELWVDRLIVSYDLSMALKYLHDHSIVYRDLKPDNIGFDIRGDVKIFDFGLAKEMRPEDMVSDELYEMSGHTGSLRYMAPEVARRSPYNNTVDVYSFGILLWQILSLQQPFDGYDVEKHSERVVYGTDRPNLDTKNWSADICNLLSLCWSSHIPDRPDFGTISIFLKREFNPFISDVEASMLDISNKTAKSMEA